MLQLDFVAKAATATAQAASGPAQASSEQTAPGSVIVQANSVSHAKEYAQFMRACKNKKKFSVDLKEHYDTDKIDLFNEWLKCGKDLGQVKLAMRRRHVSRKSSDQLHGFRKRKWLLDQYNNDEKKVAEIIARKTSAGLWAPDPEFPDDIQERFYWVLVDVSALLQQVHEDETEVSGSGSLEHEQAQELVGEGGFLAAGA